MPQTNYMNWTYPSFKLKPYFVEISSLFNEIDADVYDIDTRVSAVESEVGSAATTLDSAYDYGTAGGGRYITADSGAVEITVPNGSRNEGITIVQNDDTPALKLINNDSAYALWIQGSGNKEIFTDGDSILTASSDLYLGARSNQISLNDISNLSLSGFIATSIIGALNELRSMPSAGSGTLDEAYDYGGAGAGRSITADSGAVEITAAGFGGTGLEINSAGFGGTPLVITQDAIGSSIVLEGSSREITSVDGDISFTMLVTTPNQRTLNIGASSNTNTSCTVDISSESASSTGYLTVRGENIKVGSFVDIITTDLVLQVANDSYGLSFRAYGSEIPFNEAGDIALDGGFSATSIVGALNELKTTTASSNVTVVDVSTSTHPLASGEDALHISRTSTGTCTITLTTAETVSGRTVDIKDTGFNSSAYSIFIETEGSQLIEGEPDAELNIDGVSITLRSDGTNWIIK